MSKSVARRLALQTTGREGDLVAACIQLLRARGWFAIRQNVARIVLTDAKGKRRMIRQGEVGMVDVLALKRDNAWCVQKLGEMPAPGFRSLALGLECKRGMAKPTAAQLVMHKRLEACGVRVLVIRDIAQLAEALR